MFGLNDLVLLRSAKALAERKVSKSRIQKALAKLKRELPEGSGAGVSLTASGQELVLGVGGRRFSAENGQGVFDFSRGPTGATWLRPTRSAEAEGLFAQAVETEETNPAEAVDRYTEALAANPHHADAHVNLGRLLHTKGRLREAEAHYVAALVGRPKDPIATFNLAVVLDDQGRVDEAIHLYSEAIALDPKNADAYLNLARLYEKKGEKLAAIRSLKDARKLLS